jgi:hypothetical protein
MLARKPSSAPVSRGSSGVSGHINQHGSVHGEINRHEYQAGLHREIDHAFHGSERESINAMIRQQFDNSASNRRNVMDAREAKALVDDVHKAFSREHADKLRAILDKRLQ